LSYVLAYMYINWIPFMLSLTWLAHFVGRCPIHPSGVYFTYSLLSSVSTAINPVIYGFMNSTLRMREYWSPAPLHSVIVCCLSKTAGLPHHAQILTLNAPRVVLWTLTKICSKYDPEWVQLRLKQVLTESRCTDQLHHKWVCPRPLEVYSMNVSMDMYPYQALEPGIVQGERLTLMVVWPKVEAII